MSMDMISTVLVGGSFGKHINVEKSVQLGLLPDVPWENFQFLGNTSVRARIWRCWTTMPASVSPSLPVA